LSTTKKKSHDQIKNLRVFHFSQIMEGENVVIEEEMSVEEDKFGGVTLTVKKDMDSASFASNLEDSISHWKQQVI